jgi:DNA-binding XRE family transcriptional regulator
MTPEKLSKQTIKTIQTNVTRLRSELDLTQQQLADKMGLFRQTIVAIENRANGFSLITLCKLAIALDTTIINLMTEENED